MSTILEKIAAIESEVDRKLYLNSATLLTNHLKCNFFCRWPEPKKIKLQLVI